MSQAKYPTVNPADRSAAEETDAPERYMLSDKNLDSGNITANSLVPADL